MNTNPAEIKQLKTAIFTLTELMEQDTIKMPDVALKEMEKNIFIAKEKAVKEVHGTRAITMLECGERAGQWQAFVNSKRIRKKTYEELIEAMFEAYYPDGFVENLTFKEGFERMMKYRAEKGKVSNLTLTHYRCEYSKYVAGSGLDKMQLREITTRDLKHFFDDHTGLDPDTNDWRMTKKQFNNLKTVISKTLEYAALEGLIDYNPLQNITFNDYQFRLEQVEDSDYFSQEDRDLVLRYLNSLERETTYQLAIHFMFCTICRIGEIKALRWSDVQADKQGRWFIAIKREVVDRKKGYRNRVQVELNHTKGNRASGRRRMQLSSEALKVLGILRMQNPKAQEDALIFQTRTGGFLNTNRFNENLKRICNAVNIPYRSSHKMRFYGIAACAEASGNIVAVQKAAGHSSINMTNAYATKGGLALNSVWIPEWESVLGAPREVPESGEMTGKTSEDV